jgi:hypothetical protein
MMKRIVLAILVVGSAAYWPAKAQTPKDYLVAQATSSESPERIEPTFFEDEQDPEIRGDGFAATFLSDALGGVGDPLSGGAAASTTVDSLQKVAPGETRRALQLSPQPVTVQQQPIAVPPQPITVPTQPVGVPPQPAVTPRQPTGAFIELPNSRPAGAFIELPPSP